MFFGDNFMLLSYVRIHVGWLRKSPFAGQTDIWLSPWVNLKMFSCIRFLSEFFLTDMTLKWFFIQVNCSLVNTSRMFSLKFFTAPFIAAKITFPGFLCWSIWNRFRFGMNQIQLSGRLLPGGSGFVMERRGSPPVKMFGLGTLCWSQTKDTEVMFSSWITYKHRFISFLLWSTVWLFVFIKSSFVPSFFIRCWCQSSRCVQQDVIEQQRSLSGEPLQLHGLILLNDRQMSAILNGVGGRPARHMLKLVCFCTFTSIQASAEFSLPPSSFGVIVNPPHLSV